MIKKYILILTSCTMLVSAISVFAVTKLSPKMRVVQTDTNLELQQKLQDWQKLFLDIQVLQDKDILEETPRVVSDKDGKVMSIDNDMVYINKLSNINYYNPMGVYRIDQPVRDYQTKKVLGFPFYFLSNAKLIKHNVENDLSLLQLAKVNGEVIIGDRVLNKQREKSLDIKDIKKNKNKKINGHIATIVQGVKHADVGKSIIINIGKKDKVKPGELLLVEKQILVKRSIQLHEEQHFKPNHFFSDGSDKNAGKRVELPKEKIGTILVYRVFDDSSLALVVDAKEPLEIKQTVVAFDK